MTRIRTRLILIFAAATLLPLATTIWITKALLERSLSLSTTRELDQVSKTLQETGKALYRNAREKLRADVDAGRVKPIQRFSGPEGLDEVAREFQLSGEAERTWTAAPNGSRLHMMVRRGDDVLVYAIPIGGPGMDTIARQYSDARAAVDEASGRDLRRGFVTTLLVLAAAVWLVSLGLLVLLARRISRPLEELTEGLQQLASGNLRARLMPKKMDEVGEAMAAFNHSAIQLEQSQERLVHMTRLASWQVLARKMAHEVKNSLTPIRLTMEELVARKDDPADGFLEQAAQIVVDEVTTLERRARAFSQFASEPPVNLTDVDMKSLLEERIAFLKHGNPGVVYAQQQTTDFALAIADEDLMRGVLTNLLENAAQAAGAGGTVLGKISADDGKVLVEIHDSGPGLSALARKSLFEPTISFKKAGMGLGLSIAKRSAMMLGGDLTVVEGELGGAGFCVRLPRTKANGNETNRNSG